MELKQVDIGTEIKRKFEKSKMTQKEFGKLLGIPQQNVSRIFNKKSIETSKLIKISNVLGFNFFTLYSPESSSSNIEIETQGDYSPATNDGDVQIVVGDAFLAERVKAQEAIIAEKNERIKELKERIEELKAK